MRNKDEYLRIFSEKATEVGFDMGACGQNWAPLKDFIRGCHVSLSAEANRIRVNFNDARPRNRECFERLLQQRIKIEQAIGESLDWDLVEGRQKTAIRAAHPAGYADLLTWNEQHRWAIKTIVRFQCVLVPRVVAAIFSDQPIGLR